MAGRKPGTPKTGGRQKGTPNKLGAQVREMLLEALDKKGGVKYLMAAADSHPAAFLALLGRVLPTQVEGAGEEGEHKFTITWLK
jgi:hypothetical protein